MAKPKSSAPLVEQSSREPAVYPAAEAGFDDIERLRDILFGSQTRSLDKRLGDLEIRLDAMRQEMVSLLTEKVDSLSDSVSAYLVETRHEFNSKLTDQGKEHTIQVRAVQKELSDQLHVAQKELSNRLGKQENEQSAQLRTVQQEASKALEKLAVDLLRQITDVQKELNERLNTINAEQAERMRSLQSEAQRRNDGLRRELLSLIASLESGKASRQDLGQMLMELGARLQKEA